MGTLEIILIILGIVIIFFSCKIVGQGQDKYQERINPDYNQLTEEEKEQLKKGLHDIMADIKSETILETDEELRQLSNEKIISVSELSDQVLEKIKNNHEDVIFLYNMLNDKEKELKTLVKEINLSKSLISKDNNETLNKETKPSVQEEKSLGKPDEQESKARNTNNNKQILNLFSKGKSIDEIAKELDIGHGEVDLVINLFKR